MNRDRIRTIFLNNGFTVKEGQDDLKPYVFQAAEAVLAEMQAENTALRAALSRLEVAANTAAYCYDRRPENFASALNSLQDDAAAARELLK